MGKVTHQEALELVFADKLKERDGYVEVPTSLFVDQIDIKMPDLPSIAFYTQKGKEFELLKEAAKAYSPLALSVHEGIWVQDKDKPAVRRFADSVLIATSPDKSGLNEAKLTILRNSAMRVVDDLFQSPTPENINKSTKVVGSFVYVLMRDPKAYFHLNKLLGHDPYTLQHSVGAAVNSIILARKVGIKDEKDLFDVGLGGLLHDIGKVHVKREIINKPGPLDELEWQEMRQHALAGFEIVATNSNVPERSKRAILEHHEDKDGTGYPRGLKHADVDIYSKIVGLSDIFNALTTTRSYSNARSPFEAFELIRDKMKHKVDADLFHQLVMVYGGKLPDPT